MNRVRHIGPLSADKGLTRRKKRSPEANFEFNRSFRPTERINRQKKKAPETEFRKPFSFLAA